MPRGSALAQRKRAQHAVSMTRVLEALLLSGRPLRFTEAVAESGLSVGVVDRSLKSLMALDLVLCLTTLAGDRTYLSDDNVLRHARTTWDGLAAYYLPWSEVCVHCGKGEMARCHLSRHERGGVMMDSHAFEAKED